MKGKTKKPSKQRKMLFQTSHHRSGKIMSSHLSSELKASHSRRAVPVRTGDTVRLLRGDHKGFEGKVTRVDRKRFVIFVEGITRAKADGSSILVPTHPSKVEVINLNLDDNWRKESLKVGRTAEETKMPEEKITEKAKETAEGETSEKVSAESGGS